MTTHMRADEQTIRDAVELACRAPSLHNSQPWRWELRRGVLHLYGDAARVLDLTDPSGRQMVISCGAALHHLQVALSQYSIQPIVSRLPDPAEPSHLAAVEFRSVAQADARDTALLIAIGQRHTDRRPFLAPLKGALADLERAAFRFGASLAVLGADGPRYLARATQVSAAARRYDEAYWNEMTWWSGHSRATEGIPPAVLPAGGADSAVEVAREFPLGTLTPNREGPDQAALVVLSTPSDSRLDWLHTGEALSSVLLEATATHQATCPLTHLTEVAASRAIVLEAAASVGETFRFPQLIVRIGSREIPRLPAQTGRRPVDEVFRSVG